MLLSTPPRRGGGTIKGNPGGNLAYGASIMTRPGKLIPILGLVAVVFFVAVYRCDPDPFRKPRPDPDLSAPSIKHLSSRGSRSSRPSSTDDRYPTLSTPQGDRDARAAQHALGGHACRSRGDRRRRPPRHGRRIPGGQVAAPRAGTDARFHRQGDRQARAGGAAAEQIGPGVRQARGRHPGAARYRARGRRR